MREENPQSQFEINKKQTTIISAALEVGHDILYPSLLFPNINYKERKYMNKPQTLITVNAPLWPNTGFI